MPTPRVDPLSFSVGLRQQSWAWPRCECVCQTSLCSPGAPRLQRRRGLCVARECSRLERGVRVPFPHGRRDHIIARTQPRRRMLMFSRDAVQQCETSGIRQRAFACGWIYGGIQLRSAALFIGRNCGFHAPSFYRRETRSEGTGQMSGVSDPIWTRKAKRPSDRSLSLCFAGWGTRIRIYAIRY